jgi:hypothetical protein
MRAPSGQKVRAAGFCWSAMESAKANDGGSAPAMAAIAPALSTLRREVIVSISLRVANWADVSVLDQVVSCHVAVGCASGASSRSSAVSHLIHFRSSTKIE